MAGEEQTCRHCGNKYPHVGGTESCPAFGRTCYLCEQANHFAKFCPKNLKKGNYQGQRKAKFVHEVDDTKHDEYVFMIDDTVCVESVDMSHDTVKDAQSRIGHTHVLIPGNNPINIQHKINTCL